MRIDNSHLKCLYMHILTGCLYTTDKSKEFENFLFIGLLYTNSRFKVLEMCSFYWFHVFKRYILSLRNAPIYWSRFQMVDLKCYA